MRRTDVRSNRRRRTPRRVTGAFVGLALLSTAVLSGCANLAAQDLCARYDDLAAAAQELRDLDPVSTDVEELRAAAADVRVALDGFQAVSEGRLDDALTRLRENADAVREAAVDAGAEARETVQPLIEDSLARVQEAWAIVEGFAEAQCPAAG